MPSAADQSHVPTCNGTRASTRGSTSYTKETRGPAQVPRLQSSASGPTGEELNCSPCTTQPYHRLPLCDAGTSESVTALPPIPGSEQGAPQTPTPSHHSLFPSREPPQSLVAAVERMTVTPSQSPGNVCGSSDRSSESGYRSAPESPPCKTEEEGRSVGEGRYSNKACNGPHHQRRPRGDACDGRLRVILNRRDYTCLDATLKLNPIKTRAARTPILIDPLCLTGSARTVETLSIGYVTRNHHDPSFACLSFCSYSCSAHPILPQDLASNTQQLVESEFAQQYFATHRTGFIFKRKVPVGQMMTWQRGRLCHTLA